MPKMTARPRGRRRRIEGTELLDVLARCGAGPTSDEDARAVARLWFEVRDDETDEEKARSYHWAHAVLDLGEEPDIDADLRLIAIEAEGGDVDRAREDIRQEQARFVSIARSVYEVGR